MDRGGRPVHAGDQREDLVLTDELLDAGLGAGDLTRAVVAVDDRHPTAEDAAAVVDRGMRGQVAAHHAASTSTLPSAMPCMLTEPSLMGSLVTPTSVAPFFCSAIFAFFCGLGGRLELLDRRSLASLVPALALVSALAAGFAALARSWRPWCRSWRPWRRPWPWSSGGGVGSRSSLFGGRSGLLGRGVGGGSFRPPRRERQRRGRQPAAGQPGSCRRRRHHRRRAREPWTPRPGRP